MDFLPASGLRLPFADASFGKVICAEVLEHIPEYQSLLGEIHRVLRPGGTLAVSVPRFGPEWLCWQLFAAYHQDDGGHVRIFKAKELQGAIVATGVWHHFLISRDEQFLCALWPAVKRALDFVIGLQTPSGEIYWAQDARTGISKDALVTGCSSIYKSLECAPNIASMLSEDHDAWRRARDKLGHAIRHRPERFDRTWETKARYSMDWFYPVLAGVYRGAAAQRGLDARWDTFVAGDRGCRCVADQPWVTVAESCELAMACVGAGLIQRGNDMFDNLAGYQAEEGSWWTGYAFEDQVMWPDKRPTWTAGAVILAADALDRLTPAGSLSTGVDLPDPA